ncbi:LacI family DNA-binding transcriptional regulator [Microbacterium hydrocarbonoxydans]|uniref:LacI family DNA-binding transcriptional regulator n=1 Tax=Microbacterium hydrocarbonoxydans TaxID=273678 RepID=UPI00203E405A|nr:LacI family DNA-binding transcriptional regulator [Microbacterium hydrocarbonoxydans]MCM3778411.1 LacI family transcriptional regulator [Microbacterium hydrocarbonoxydans]
MSNPATIYEVASRAGVSISTVSLAINHPARVSAKTRTLVLAAADELGFVPKERAIARAKAGVGRIAMVAPFSSYPSFAERMAGAMEALGDDGTQFVVFDHEDIATSDSPLLDTLPVRGHVDGLIIMGIPLQDAAAERLATRLPTVLVDQKHPLLSSVWVDDLGGGQLVGARLLAGGHRRVVFVRETETSFLDDSPAQQRVDGLRSVMGDDAVREITISRTPSAGREVIAEYWGDGADWRPTAVFAHRDLVALSVLGAAREAGLHVPGDVSIIGYDDDDSAAALDLSTVANPLRESGREAIRLLREMIAHPDAAPTQVELPLMFRARGSSGPAPQS